MSHELTDLHARYRPLGTVKAKELLLDRVNALRFLDDLESRGIPITDVELWYTVPAGIVDAWWLSPDFRGVEVRDRPERVRRLILSELTDDIKYVSINFDGSAELWSE